MKALKAIAILGFLVLLVFLLVHMAQQWMGVKSAEPSLKNLPKIKKELKEAAGEREKQIDRASGEDEGEKKEQE